MSNPKEPTDLAQLQQENAELKLRVQRLQLNLDLSIAHQKKEYHNSTIFWAGCATLIALFLTVHLFSGQGFTGPLSLISSGAAFGWLIACLMWFNFFFSRRMQSKR